MVVYDIEPFGSFARIGNRNEVCAKVSGSNFGGICEQIQVFPHKGGVRILEVNLCVKTKPNFVSLV